MTQKDRVLRALEDAGEVGITQGDFLLPDVVDGGKPVTRVGARIKDLREDGHAIDSTGVRNSFAVYVLRSVPKPAATPDWNWPDKPSPTQELLHKPIEAIFS